MKSPTSRRAALFVSSSRYSCPPYLLPSSPICRRRDIYDTPLLLCPACGADAVSAAPCSLASKFGLRVGSVCISFAFLHQISLKPLNFTLSLLHRIALVLGLAFRFVLCSCLHADLLGAPPFPWWPFASHTSSRHRGVPVPALSPLQCHPGFTPVSSRVWVALQLLSCSALKFVTPWSPSRVCTCPLLFAYLSCLFRVTMS